MKLSTPNPLIPNAWEIRWQEACIELSRHPYYIGFSGRLCVESTWKRDLRIIECTEKSVDCHVSETAMWGQERELANTLEGNWLFTRLGRCLKAYKSQRRQRSNSVENKRWKKWWNGRSLWHWETSELEKYKFSKQRFWLAVIKVTEIWLGRLKVEKFIQLIGRS